MEETNFSVMATLGYGGAFIAAACWKGQKERQIGKRPIGSISRVSSLWLMLFEQDNILLQRESTTAAQRRSDKSDKTPP